MLEDEAEDTADAEQEIEEKHDHHVDHGGGEGGQEHGRGHEGQEQMFRRRFLVSTLLSIPVLLYSPALQDWLNFSVPTFPESEWINLVFAVVVFASGLAASHRTRELAREFASTVEETSYDRYFRFWREVLYPFCREHAQAAIREGAPPGTVYEWLDEHPDRWPVAQVAFELTAELIGDEIASQLDIPEGGSVLNIDGGHAL